MSKGINAQNILLVLWLLVALLIPLPANSQAKTNDQFRSILTDDFLNDQGFKNLSAAERALLRNFLSYAYQLGVEDTLVHIQALPNYQSATGANCPNSQDVINSNVLGEFNG